MTKSDICVRQFQCKKFGFYCSKEEKELFYVSQWSSNRIVFLIYRIFMCMYALGWALAYFIVSGIYEPARLPTDYRFLTNWGEVVNVIYFALALALTAVGAYKRNKTAGKEHANTIDTLFTVGIKVLRGFMWLFQSKNQVLSFIVTVVFWAALSLPPTPFRVHGNGIIFVTVVIDLFVAANPVCLFHFIYAMFIGLIYTLMLVILHAAGVVSSIYGFLDWANNPGLAAGVALALSIPATALIQAGFFGLYCLRLFIHSKFCLQTKLTKISPGPDDATPKQLQGSLQDASSATSSVTLPTGNAA